MDVNIKLEIIGAINNEHDKQYYEELRKMTSDRNLNDWITFHVDTKSNTDEINQILEKSDVRLHTRLDEWRSIAIFESIISGSPVVAFRAGGNPETVVNNVNGMLVSPFTSQALASSLFQYIADKELRLKMSSLASLSDIQTYNQDEKYFKIMKLLSNNL